MYVATDNILCLKYLQCHNCYTGMENGTIGDMKELGITEAFIVKQQMLLSAAEAAEMILRVDDIIKAAPR